MKTISGLLVAGLVTGAFVMSSHGDAPIQPSASPPTLPEPTSHPPVMPKPGDEQPPRDPFTPYAHGSPAPWEYGDLTVAEQDVVDRGVDTTKWEPVHAAFDAATVKQAQEAATEAAAVTLGVSDLTSIGVVP